MYTCIHRVYMWEVEPTLYWRVKKNGKWTWVRAQEETDERLSGVRANYFVVKPLLPEVDESD